MERGAVNVMVLLHFTALGLYLATVIICRARAASAVPAGAKPGGFPPPDAYRRGEPPRDALLGASRLVIRPRELAAEVAREFFLRFGWAPAIDQLVDYQ